MCQAEYVQKYKIPENLANNVLMHSCFLFSLNEIIRCLQPLENMPQSILMTTTYIKPEIFSDIDASSTNINI